MDGRQVRRKGGGCLPHLSVVVRDGKCACVVIDIGLRRHPHLVQVDDASNPLCRRLGVAHGRQEQTGERPDDGDHHEKLDQGECGHGGASRAIAGRTRVNRLVTPGSATLRVAES